MKALDIVRERFPNVKSVRDAKRPLAVKVTKRDCNSQKVKNHQECAMAAAIQREYKPDGVMVSLKSAYVINGNKAIRYSVPSATAREVISFDRHSDFEPGEYKLNHVPPSMELGSRSTRARNSDGGNGKRTKEGIAKRFFHKTGNVRTKLGSREWRASSI